MSNEPDLTPASTFAGGAHVLRRFWRLVLFLGIGLVLLGLTALSCTQLATEVAVMYLGILLMASGIANIAHGMQTRRWEGSSLALLTGVLDFVVGLLMITHTGKVAELMTLLLAAFFFIGGLFRILVAVSLRFPGWLWLLITGVVGMMLGAAIWRRWPLDSEWVIGLFLGIDLLFRGWSLVMLALAVRPLPGTTAPPG